MTAEILETGRAVSKDDSRVIVDYVSGISVPNGPEEIHATQPFSRLLVEDYGYPVENIRTRPQYSVKANPSDRRKSVPVDIAVFGSSEHTANNLQIIVECKAPGESPEEDDDKQIFNYLNWSSAEIGVWTNGDDREVWHKTVDQAGKLKYELLPALPRYGERVSEIGKYRRNQLTVPKNLQHEFRTIRAHLAGNALGTTRDEIIAQQMINLIFCKIFDERFKAPNDMVDFRATIADSNEEVLNRITALFNRVKSKYHEVFDESDRLTLDAASVKHVVGVLQPHALTEAGRDAVGEAFEVFIGGTLKGEQGQFFTPRNVVRLMVELASPKREAQVIDPACGAGGFIIEALRHKWNQVEELGALNEWDAAAIQEEKTSIAMKTVKGIDKDSFLARVAKAYMAIMGDGKGSIYVEDSLERPEKWAQAQSDVHLNSFDVVLANPPFGKEIKVKGSEKLSQYDLAFKWKSGEKTDVLNKEMNPQVLFVERCLQLARKGGVIGIILPETYFHAPSTRHVREVLLYRNNVKAIIDLPHNTFRPFNNAKCIAVIVEKDVPQQETVIGVVAEEMGHDHLGRPVFRYDKDRGFVTEEVWDDISEATDAVQKGYDCDNVFAIDSAQLRESDIWVPRYYWSPFNEDVRNTEPHPVEWVTLGDLIDSGVVDDSPGHGSPASTDKGMGPYTYARVKDIVNWEIYRDPTSGISERVLDEFTRSNPLVEGDVVYVSRGSYRIGDVAYVSDSDVETVLTREIRRFRVRDDNSFGLTSYYLLYLLSTESVRQQTRGRIFMDTTLPNISDRYRSIRLPWATEESDRRRISEQVERAVTARASAMARIREMTGDRR